MRRHWQCLQARSVCPAVIWVTALVITGGTLQVSCAINDVKTPGLGKALLVITMAAVSSAVSSALWGGTVGLALAWFASKWVALGTTWLVSLLAVSTVFSATLRVSWGKGFGVALAYRAAWMLLGGVAWLVSGILF